MTPCMRNDALMSSVTAAFRIKWNISSAQSRDMQESLHVIHDACQMATDHELPALYISFRSTWARCLPQTITYEVCNSSRHCSSLFCRMIKCQHGHLSLLHLIVFIVRTLSNYNRS